MALRFHKQNLDRNGNGCFLKHGRWWLTLCRVARNEQSLRCEWIWKLGVPGFRVSLGGGDSDRELAVSLYGPLLCVWLALDMPRWFCERLLPWRPYTFQENKGARTIKITSEREVELTWHGSGFWWALWMDPNEWQSTDSKWRRGHFNPTDFLLGRREYSEGEKEIHRSEIPMPEGVYPTTIELYDGIWRRPRWPFTNRLRRANIKPDKPIPHPGKGENSWDCGEDATWEMTTQAKSVSEAVGQMVQAVYRDRLRYGGPNWRPANHIHDGVKT